MGTATDQLGGASPKITSTDTDISSNTSTKHPWWSRDRYAGALLFNLTTFILPTLYGTLTKLWIAGIDSSLIATTETYTYIGVVVEVINEGLPRAAYKIIGDRTRRSLNRRIGISNALILTQVILGLIMSIAIFAAAKQFADKFVPEETRAESVQYIRIAAFSSLFSALDVAVSACTRSLDRPDVPLVISSVKTALNIVLDLLFLSKHRVTTIEVDANTQAIIRLLCDGLGATAGLVYYLWLAGLLRRGRSAVAGSETRRPTVSGLKLLARPGSYTFAESALRNALYLWLVSGIVDMGADWANAWGIFNTIRWGLVMVPVYALEATSATFVGHAWGAYKARPRVRPTLRTLLPVARPALISAPIALAVEIPLFLIMSFATVRPFARYLSNSDAVAEITAHMWKTIDWCYIFYAVNTQLASILLAAKPRWYLLQSALSNVLWTLPWAIAIQKVSSGGWRWYAIVFGGSMVVSFGCVLVVLGGLIWSLKRGWRRTERAAVEVSG